jgi:pSer/pThr/pTyr-binding forkhead associated (FHA) protein
MSEAFLKILSGPREGLNIPLSSSPILIGRKKGDIIINDPLISGTHAKIYPAKDGWYIEDLNSTNGTLVDGHLTSRTKLRPGAEMALGNSRMVLFVGLAAHKEEEVSNKSTKSRLEIAWLLDEELVELEEGKDSTQTAKDVINKDLRLPTNIKAMMEVVAGQDVGKTYRFTNGTMTVGRRTGEIPLTDVEVSRKHAVVEMFSRDMVFLRDLGSTNGTFHNGRRINSAKLQNGDTIGLGRSVLRLRLK